MLNTETLWSLTITFPLLAIGVALLQGAWQGKFATLLYFIKGAVIVAGTVIVIVGLSLVINAYLIFLTLPWSIIIGSSLLLGATLLRNNSPKESLIPPWGRLACTVLGVLVITAAVAYPNRERLATMAYRQAIKQGTTCPMAEDVAGMLRHWAPLAQLPPSPEKETLTAMVTYLMPPQEFWDAVLSLPPSPERHELVASLIPFADSQIRAEMYTRLYDEPKQDTKTMQLIAQSEGGYPTWLSVIIRANRADILKKGLETVENSFAVAEDLIRTAVDMKNTQILFQLLDRGLAPYARWRFTVLHYAVEQNNEAITKALLEYGYSPENDCSPYPLYSAPQQLPPVLLAQTPHQCLEQGNTALHVAALNATDCTIINLLVGHGFDRNAPNKQGQTPLHLAASQEWQLTPLNCLLKAGADPTLQDANGSTPLHVAVKNNDINMAKRLIQFQPDLATIQDTAGKTPLEYAINLPEMINVLEGKETRAERPYKEDP